MPYKVEYDKIEGFYLGFLGPSLSTLVNGGLANTEKAVKSLIVSANIGGSTADRMREYFSDVHITALNMIKKVASLMVIQLQKYIYTYNALVDSHVNARFSSQEFCDIATELTGDVNHAEYIDNEVRRILADISPLYTPNNVGGYRGVYDSVQLINNIKIQLDTLDTQIKQIESEFSTTALSEIDMLLDLLESYVVNNAGHDSVYISSYHGEAKDDTYRALVRHEKTLSDYISEHSDDYVEINDYIRDRATARSQGEINVKLRKDLKKAAQTVRIMGYVGDACIAIGKLALIAYGAPKPAVDVVGGATGGAWKNWYTEISDEMESYNLGDGALVEKDKLVEKTIVGGVEGTATGLISVGTDAIFSSVGEAGFVGKLTNSDNPVIKHTTKIGLKYVEKEIESVEGGISKRYIEAKAEEITRGKTEDGRSAFEIAFDLETIKKEEIDEGGWAKTGAETLVSYTFSEISGEGKGTKDSSKSGLETYDVKRTISKSSLKGAETILSETLGTGAKAMAATPNEGESRLEAGLKAVEELYTDEKEREKMISKTAVKMASTAFDDIEKQTNRVLEPVEDPKQIATIRQKAVRDAWAREKQLVLQGKGTRDWTVAQQAELIEYGTVSGFEGQHMLSVADYPEQAGNPDNIQFLTYEEHFYGAHRGDFHNETSGRFDPNSGRMIEATNGKVPTATVIDLTDKYDPSQQELTAQLGREYGYNRREDIQDSRQRHKGEKSIKQ